MAQIVDPGGFGGGRSGRRATVRGVPTDAALDPVAVTSRVTAAMRAQESERPDRLFADPFAATLAGDAGRAIVARTGEAGGAIPVRTRFFDDSVLAALPGQLVLVAAGMDTRAWRLPLPEGTTVFELDRPGLLDLKAWLLEGALTRAPRTPVGVDLTGPWPAALAAAGHDATRPTVWLAEGLTQYLPAAAVGTLLDAVTARSAPGSTLLLDVVGTRLMTDPGAQGMLAAMERMGSPWVFATDDPGALLEARGWTPDVRGFDAYARGVGRSAGFGERPAAAVEQGWLVTGTR